MELTFTTEPGHTYRVEYTADLAEGIWLSLGGDHFAVTSLITVIDPTGDPQRYYRIRVIE
jgi:hypothetical protein